LHPTTRLAGPHRSAEAAQAPFSHSTHPMGHVTAEGQSWNRSRHSPLGHLTCPNRHEKVSVHFDASGLQVSSGHRKPPLAQVRSVEQSSKRATHAPLRHWNWNRGSVHALEAVTGGQSLGSLTQLRPSGHTDVKGGQARLDGQSLALKRHRPEDPHWTGALGGQKLLLVAFGHADEVTLVSGSTLSTAQ
jgi:hypothetical protein